ncbi:ankyrin repeat domain-containing protein [Streptomyces sp. NPDC050788]|jgi:ankyrin repeat protein|uniref:ankyrin repeat domain-containing protein n=1 Tax=Streptomyces sp. NPDC050788 TaxID=3155041 RepID=UPI003444D8D2
MSDASDDSNWTPAHLAVEGSDYEALTILLASGTDPNERCFGRTLLSHAIDLEGDGHLQTGYRWNTAATAILLAYGADPQLPDDDGETPMQMAEYYGHTMAKELLKRFISTR